MSEPTFGDVVAEELHAKAQDARGPEHDPRRRGTHRSRQPQTTATSALAMMGSPAGSQGVTSSAKTIDDAATTRRNDVMSRGQSSPKNAAGTAASSPHDAGFPSAFAPIAPSNVKRFQKI